MPKRQQLTPFQHELLARERDQARIEHNRQVEQSVFLLAKESEKNRKQLIVLKQASVATLKQVIYNKQVLRRQPEPYSDLKLDHQSDDEVESDSDTSSQHSEENTLQPFGYVELILGLIIHRFLYMFLFRFPIGERIDAPHKAHAIARHRQFRMDDTNMNPTDELENSGYESQVDPNQTLEDPYDFVPRVVTQTPGTIEDIQQKLRTGGLS
jgi:hypothetical protein